MDDLLEHEILEQLHDSARSLVYRARSVADGAALIVKVPNQEFPSFRDIAQFKREYAIALRCRHPGVVRPIGLHLNAGRWTMIQEDIGGEALDKLLRACAGGLALDEFFDIALQLCAALDEVHRQGVIHKDINPSNLVWNRERRLLQLIDFGIAGELPQETQGIVNPHALEGTLRYMAPEQTGRMNRLVDYRADFYALGATFYELLTGQAPFAIPHQVGRIDVLVDHALAVDFVERRAQLQRDVEEFIERKAADARAQQLVQRLAADVFLDHRPAPCVQV
jgi:serine/threonine protein kinase